MARPLRLSLPSYPHHVIQRGNNRQPIFLAPKDYEVFLECLREAKRKCRARLYAYVLMTNHVHLLVEPEQEGGLGRFMQIVGRRYVRYINDAHARTETLWEGRFKSAVVSRDEYLIMCSRYIELNPVRAGMVRHPRDSDGAVIIGARWGAQMTWSMRIPGMSVWGTPLRIARVSMPPGWRPPSRTTNGNSFDEQRRRGEWWEVTVSKKKSEAKSGGV